MWKLPSFFVRVDLKVKSLDMDEAYLIATWLITLFDGCLFI